MKTLDVVLVSGSHRKESQSRKVMRFAAQSLLRLAADAKPHTIDLGEAPLPMWDECPSDADPARLDAWAPIAATLAAADAIVLVSPEWAGMAPPALKNFVLLCSGDACVAHKPALIVSVSASLGGSYPVAELRMSAGKNTKMCFVPEHVIVRRVGEVLNDDEVSAGDVDAQTRARLRHGLEVLLHYARALREVRKHPIVSDARFRFGM